MSLPVIGVALAVPELAAHRDWLLEKQRDLEVQTFHEAAVLLGDWQPLAAEVRRQLDGHTGRLGIHGPFWGFSLATPDPDVQALVRTRMSQGLDVCEAISATQMVVHSPVTAWDHNNLPNVPGGWERLVDCVHACLGEAVARAADQGVTLVMENIEDKDPRARRALCQSFGSPALRLSLDTGHAHYAHGSTGAPPVDHYVSAAGGLLDHIHLQDADGYADRHWAIGEGSVPWPAVFRAIAACGAAPRLILELRDKTGIAASMEYLEARGLGQ